MTTRRSPGIRSEGRGATAPPQRLNTSQGMSSSRRTPTLATENASLCSTSSKSSILNPVRFMSFFTQGIGANMTSCGFTAWEQKSPITPRGSIPISRALASLMRTVALAPSEIWEQLPAVRTPSFLKTVGSLASAASVVSGRMPSSRSTTTFLPPAVVSTGAISFANRPDSVALRAYVCERSAYSSHISLVRCSRSAMISPPMAMWKSL